ncbi:MAG TPA: arsenate reductase ArsC [Candidatus Margulisbacteria bacterium]|nr:MAG: arsenate reductase [Candidatus Margulisbacteria bacterium GWD2_39_127]OGI04860.1 MAG: arsenate reductase [Candidatus Margulisbacteria bacterium GWF2_38_17]HAR64180.1 arsenate reductase ArsC [Candidatus Margulisiibacteriota bacterium]
MIKKKVLFVCIHNSARSQMAEEYLTLYGGEKFEVESAGLEPGTLNPIVVDVLKEDGIDISGKKTNDAFEFFREGRAYNYVVTVCDETSGERCPLFPGKSERLHWSFTDPSSFMGTYEEKLEKTRAVSQEIKAKIKEFLALSKEPFRIQ